MLAALMLLAGLQQAIWESVKPPVLHQGWWQSCNGEERVLQHRVLGKFRWELHLGPRDEFALYTREVDHEAGDGAHERADNLLAPAYRVGDVSTLRGDRTWHKIGLWINVRRAGSAEDDCQSFYVRVEAKR